MARASAGSPREEVTQAVEQLIAQEISDMPVPAPPAVTPSAVGVERVGEMLRQELASANLAAMQSAKRAYTS